MIFKVLVVLHSHDLFYRVRLKEWPLHVILHPEVRVDSQDDETDQADEVDLKPHGWIIVNPVEHEDVPGYAQNRDQETKGSLESPWHIWHAESQLDHIDVEKEVDDNPEDAGYFQKEI